MKIIAESEKRDNRDGGQGWQKIRWWRRGEIETASEKMWHRGKMIGTTKLFGMPSATEFKYGIRYAGRCH